ncbi:MAG TPA: transcription antitermination factor NusB [Actinomycetota bacterium]|nr:transcription antitermination factor NusB [Actinomycetota bacterium]
MASRRQARRQALDVLYQADVTGADPHLVLEDLERAGKPIDPFARELVEGVAAHRSEIDGHLQRLAEDWTVDRMASLDRTILRIACFELLHRPDTPPGAAIDEAVQAAKELSTEDSSRFVNGILGRLARERTEALDAPPSDPR